jgi:UDP-N-acetylmuramate--alanine ligase
MQVANFYRYMKPGLTGHLVGIGGVSMSALAEVLRAMGLNIRGSDDMESQTVLTLREKGIRVIKGLSGANVEGADFIVRTAAVKDSNPEILAARERGIPVFERTRPGELSWQGIKTLSACRAHTGRPQPLQWLLTYLWLPKKTPLL